MRIDARALAARRLRESAEVKQALAKQAGTIARIAEALVTAFRRGNKVMLFGNGGSAADAQHLAAELMGRYRMKRKGLPAIALTTNTSNLTAISNDYSFAEVFAMQLIALGQSGDVAIGISTSGASRNVVKALRVARKKGLVTVGFTGAGGGTMKALSDYCLSIPAKDTARIQESHILAGHIICEIVEHEIFA
jgi:D-sedoheptulose 7-phosphate isomerase